MRESFIIPNHEQVRRSTEQLMAQIREKLKLSANTDLRFKMHSTSVSWQHGVAFNTRQELTRKLNILFEGENIGEMGLKEMENILGQEKVVAGDDDEDCEDWEGNNLSVILEGIHDDQLVAVKNVDDLVELIYNAPDMNCEKQLFQSATEMFYDFFFNVVNSKMKGHWKDPYTDKPDIDNMYDASGLNHEEARENHRNTIQDLKITVDKCKEDRTVYVALMDRMKTAYTDEQEGLLEEFILSPEQGFFEILNFGGYVTAYAYVNETPKCLGLLLVHHAVSKAFTSCPPYGNQCQVRGRKAVEDNSKAAVTGLFLHAVMMTVRGITENFEPTTMMLGNPVTAYAMIRYCLTRWHQWDSQVSVMFGKAMLASDTDPLNSKFGLECKYRNKFERGGACFSNAEKIALLLSGARDDNIIFREAFGMMKMSHVEREMSRLQEKILVDGHLYNMLLHSIATEKGERQRKADQDKARMNEALGAELEKAKAGGRTVDEEDELGTLITQAKKPKRKKG